MVSLQQSPWLHVDDTIVPSRVESLPSSYLSSCIGQIKALRELKRAWSNLEVPRLWIDATVSDLDSGLPSDAFNHSYVALCLHHIKEYVRSVDEVNLRSRSPYDLRPNFMLPCHRHEIRPFYSEHRLMDEVTSLGSMSETQLAQFFLHQKDSFGAECAIVTALDGIPSTYVRRRDLKIFTGDGTMSISSLFCALLYTPIAPTTRDSLERFRHLSINVENPAFVLCFEDRARRQEQDTEATESSSLIQEMARTATVSLQSLVDILQKSAKYKPDSSRSTDRDTESNLDWAFLISVIHRSSTIDFVAHIPHIPPSASSYCCLSVHFATLPFPTHCPPGNTKQFLFDRYRVAYAFFCIQHHVHRLVSLWERAKRLAVISDDPAREFDDTETDHTDSSSNSTMDQSRTTMESAIDCHESGLMSEIEHLPASSGLSLLEYDDFGIGEEYMSDIPDLDVPPVQDVVKQWLNTCLELHDS